MPPLFKREAPLPGSLGAARRRAPARARRPLAPVAEAAEAALRRRRRRPGADAGDELRRRGSGLTKKLKAVSELEARVAAGLEPARAAAARSSRAGASWKRSSRRRWAR